MPASMKVTDNIRLNVLEALLKKKTVVPNLKQIKHYTGYHKATIKGSLDFLEKRGVLQGYGPKINFKELGYGLEAISLLKADMSKLKLFEKFINISQKDPNVYWVSTVMGSGNWNIITREVYRDIEDFQNKVRDLYQTMPGFYDLIKDSHIFYSVEPTYKNISRTGSILKAVKRDKGLK